MARRFRGSRIRLALFAWVALGTVVGCGTNPQTFPVTGTVQFEDGEPVRFGAVEFRHRETGSIARGQLDPRGEFVLGTFEAADGATAGEHQVVVVQAFRPEQRLSAPADEDEDEHYHEDGDEEQHELDYADHEHGEDVWLVAPSFAAYQTSGLTAIVEPKSDNRVEIVVKRFSPGRASRLARP